MGLATREQWAAKTLNLSSRFLSSDFSVNQEQPCLGSPVASSILSPSSFHSPSFTKHTLIVTQTHVVRSFLHVVQNPHPTGPPEADPSGLVPLRSQP